MPAEPRGGRFVSASVALFLVAAFSLIVLRDLQPPARVPATAPADEFSSGRALEHVRAIARIPHPTGSAEASRVREYILRAMQGLGLEALPQATTAVRSGPRRAGLAVAAGVHNLAFRMPGSDRGKSVLLVTHYDSVPTGPGASDDGSGVATLIETARALRQAPSLRNDIVFLFTDAEELGLLGAKAFVDEHPWAKEAGVVLNFEARGACGPSMMFETGARNGWLIRRLAEAAPHPIASSFMYEFYRRLPNDTDLTIFKRAGLQGLNFSYAGCWPRYHTMGDNAENLDERSLQHHGSYALALARGLGNADLSRISERDAVYFTAAGKLWHYSSRWVMPLTIVVAALFAVVLWAAARSPQWRWRSFACGVLGCLGTAVVSAAAAQVGWLIVRRASLASLLPYGMAYNSENYAAGFTLLAVAAFCAVGARLGKRHRTLGLVLGAMFWWLAGAVAAALFAPGGSYLFLWPLLLGLVAVGIQVGARAEADGMRLVAVWAVPAAVAVVLFAPIPFMLVGLLSTSGLIPLTVAVALLLGFLLPLVLVMSAAWKWWVPAAAAAAAVVFLAVGAAQRGYDESRPQAAGLFYYLDHDKGEAWFVSPDASVNEWTSHFFSGLPERGELGRFTPFTGPALVARAPVEVTDAPDLAEVEDRAAGEWRILSIRVRSRRRARALWITASGCRIVGSTIDGREIEPRPAGESWALYYAGDSGEGVALSLVMRRGDDPSFRVVDQSDGLPDFEGSRFPARPARFMPSPALIMDSSTLVSKTFAIPPP